MRFKTFLSGVVLAFSFNCVSAQIDILKYKPPQEPVEEQLVPPKTRLVAPTLQECSEQLYVPPDSSIFYAGGMGFWNKTKQLTETRSYLRGYSIISDKWVDPDWYLKWQGPDDYAEFWDVCSKALVLATQGTAYVMLPAGKGLDWTKGTVWDRIEWPNMPKDVKVIRINPDNDDMEVIHSPEKPIEVRFNIGCTVKPIGKSFKQTITISWNFSDTLAMAEYDRWRDCSAHTISV
ncbi:hypothetical protein F5Y04DRAFT_284755 [Hypomontagnella monticulosa]|nr:hypothetical protein F5Y04DRAFT_284755 [Hypomontagnella monticulosa]